MAEEGNHRVCGITWKFHVGSVSILPNDQGNPTLAKPPLDPRFLGPEL
jgi:hypothetical protein